MYTCLFRIGLIFPMLYFMGSTASKDDVSSPNDVTFGLHGMFSLFWEWKFSFANCSLEYVKKMKSLRNGEFRKAKDRSPQWEWEIYGMDVFDLNYELSLVVEAECNDIRIGSLSKTVHLAPGDDGTAVKNFQCVWYYPERVKCTWQPGPNTPKDSKFQVFYWIKDKPREERFYKLTEFWDLLETGSICEPVYRSNDMKSVECQFPLNEIIENQSQIAMVVTDTSKLIKPYIYHKDGNQIAKLKPPQIFEARRTPNNTIYVSWNKSQESNNLEYELSLTNGHEEQTRTTLSSAVLNVLPDVTYTVRVRVKISEDVLSDKRKYTWSDWSKETIVKGKGDEKLISIILSLIFSICVIIAAVFLLVNMEKLKAIICPQIPDPGRIFSKDLQQWLKTDVPIVYSKPEKEEICPVYLIESPPAMKCV